MRALYFYCIMFFALTAPAFSQVNFTSSNLPIVIINTNGQDIPDEPKIDVNMKIIYNGAGKKNNLTDTVYNFNGKIGIEIRGQTSQGFPKKQYGFEVRDVSDNDSNATILGMPAESDWILYAPYSDKTMMRNALVYRLSNDLGRYASRTQYCELILNGQYWGVYILMEKIKRGKSRVNIKKLTANDTTGDALTGGYIFKIDKSNTGQDEGWTSKYKGYPGNGYETYLYDYPKQEDIVNKQKTYIKSVMDRFEDVMNSSAYNDPFKGYYDLMDMDTFVDTYLMNEFCNNVDGYRLSTYFYKDRDSQDGRLKYGPIWDFDISLGNCDYDNCNLFSGFEVLNVSHTDPAWNRKLFSNPVFFNRFAKRWNEAKKTILKIPRVSAILDSVVTLTTEARIRNFTKWNIIGVYVWPNRTVENTYEGEVQDLKSWIANRMDWLNFNIPTTYSDITWLTPTGTNLGTGVQTKISAKVFYSSTLNVDSVTFVSSSDTLKLQSSSDSLTLSASGAGKFVIKGVAWYNNQMVSVSPAVSIGATFTGIAKDETLPSEYKLFQNYPNPFNPSTTISWQLAANSFVTLKIYNVLGNEVATLVNENQNAGMHSILFNAGQSLSNGQLKNGLTSGIYFYRIKAGGYT
ncbi:MAG: CotH kinase family protein, partial [Ignavibacteriaceae bacterium]|nr:CotH kinase family protein [Ignavibacteriaceae bacterium]